jgi:hypothetical protein
MRRIKPNHLDRRLSEFQATPPKCLTNALTASPSRATPADRFSSEPPVKVRKLLPAAQLEPSRRQTGPLPNMPSSPASTIAAPFVEDITPTQTRPRDPSWPSNSLRVPREANAGDDAQSELGGRPRDRGDRGRASTTVRRQDEAADGLLKLMQTMREYIHSNLCTQSINTP